MSGKKSSPGNTPTYVRYIGLSFQMCAIIGLGTWAGLEIQERSEMSFPLWVLVFCFTSIFIAFYQLFRSLKRDENEREKN
ncbi:MAG TPA: AtpZ/AtpI family protein [Cyclobacteriaceae bacterium]|nr:AtpZ/AtpI family protein [Cyclobacteriaceae bacterium]